MRRPLPTLLLATTLLTGLVGCSADDSARGASARASSEATLAKGRPEVPAEWREQAATSKRRQKEEGLKNKSARAHAGASARMAGSTGNDDRPQGRKARHQANNAAGSVAIDNAQGLRIMTLNAEHLMSPAVFARWQTFCEPLGWQDGPGDRRPAGLPYCDALNGRDMQGRLTFGPQHRRQDLDAKVRQLAELVRTARPDIVLMQEITDTEAVRQVLGKGWTIHTTAERWNGGPISQNLAVAWPTHRFLQEPRVEVVESLARSSPEGRRTRPGLAVYLPLPVPENLSGTTSKAVHPVPTLAILNVHLKAGCRQGRLDRSLSRQPTRQWRRLSSCQVLQSQVPALEDWLDRQIAAGHAVLISGDFNRDLRQELRQGLPARGDGSPATTPVHTSDEMQHVASVLPELDDDQPRGARLTLVASGPYRKLARCHRHIDAFLLSHNLGTWLHTPLEDLRVQVVPFEAPLSLERPRPSDHCPHVLQLPL